MINRVNEYLASPTIRQLPNNTAIRGAAVTGIALIVIAGSFIITTGIFISASNANAKSPLSSIFLKILSNLMR